MTFALFILAIIVVCLTFGMIDNMLKHQRKMAEILHRGQGGSDDRIDALEQRVGELTALIQQQTIAIDNLSRPAMPNAYEPERVKV